MYKRTRHLPSHSLMMPVMGKQRVTLSCYRSVVGVEMAKRLPLTPEDPRSNPALGIFIHSNYALVTFGKIKINVKWNGPFHVISKGTLFIK